MSAQKVIRRLRYSYDVNHVQVFYGAADELYTNVNEHTIDFSIGSLDVPNKVFPDIPTALSYLDPIGADAFVARINDSYGRSDTVDSVVSADVFGRLAALEEEIF